MTALSVPRSSFESVAVNDVAHQVSVDPVDAPCIDISDLKQGGHRRVSGTAIGLDHICHPPVAAVFNDHGHPRSDVQEHGI